MVSSIDLSDITSQEAAEKAIKTGKITREQANYIAQAFIDFREHNVLLQSKEYKINKDSKEGWEKTEREEFVNQMDMEKTKMIVLKKQLGNNPNAFVIEYIDDANTPKKFIGKQKFTWDAIKALDNEYCDIQKRLPENKGKGGYQTSLLKNFEKNFVNKGETTVKYWLSNGTYVEVYDHIVLFGSDNNPRNANFIRLLQD